MSLTLHRSSSSCCYQFQHRLQDEPTAEHRVAHSSSSSASSASSLAGVSEALLALAEAVAEASSFFYFLKPLFPTQIYDTALCALCRLPPFFGRLLMRVLRSVPIESLNALVCSLCALVVLAFPCRLLSAQWWTTSRSLWR